MDGVLAFWLGGEAKQMDALAGLHGVDSSDWRRRQNPPAGEARN